MTARAITQDPLTAAVEAVVAERFATPCLTAEWVAREALRRLSGAELRAALLTGAKLAARLALADDFAAGVGRRRYRVWRDGEACFMLMELLSQGEAVDLVVGLRAQAAAAMAHAHKIDQWRSSRWPDRDQPELEARS
jgi:hypothetical protein